MSADNIHQLFKPDENAIRAHLVRLFRRVPSEYPGGWMEIAWAEPTGAVKFAEWFSCTPDGIERAVASAAARNREHRNVYVGVNPRRPDAMPGGRASTEDIDIAFFQFAECDKIESIELLRKATIPYSFAVTTGHIPHRRPHAYWEVEDPVRNMQAWSAQQAGLRDYFKGDAVLDPPRIMRLAGTINYPAAHKEQRGYRVELVTIRTIYDNEERGPTTSAALASVYRWANFGTAGSQYDTETGEVFEEPAAGGRTRPHFDLGGLSFRELLERIENGQEWNTHLFRLIGRMVRQGYPDALIMAIARNITRPGFTEEQTSREISEILLRTRKNFNVPNRDEPLNDETEELSLPFIGTLKPSGRSPRDWLVPHRMMRKHITMTGAAPGVGKTNLAIEEAVSLASGTDFLNFGIKEIRKVAIINNEETRDELERRIEATCQHFEIPLESIAENLAIYSGVDAAKIILARLDHHKNVIPTVNTIKLRELVNDLQLDVVVLDPFVQLHYVTENVPEEISKAMIQIRTIGLSDYPAAIHLIHHNRKPAAGNSHQAGDINSLRGGSSMGGEAHFVFTLTDMGDADGEKLNVEEEDRSLYIRLDDAKGKMTPPQGARWFQRFGVMMPYGLIGEEVGILIPHDMKTSKPEVNISSATELLTIVDKAWKNGNPFNGSPRTPDRYLVNAIMKSLRMTRTNAKELMSEWLVNGVIVNVTRNAHSHLTGFMVVKWPG